MRKTMFLIANAAALAFLLHCAASSALAADSTSTSAVNQQNLLNAEQLVRAALLAEASGDVAKRAENLQQALELAHNLPSARWHSGQVLRDGRWLTVDEAEREAARTGKVEEYRKLRDAAVVPTYDDHIRLARWAGNAGLNDQERAHYILALQMHSDSAEAISKLKLVRFQGELMEKSEYESYRARLKQSTDNASEWNPRLNKLRIRYDKNPGKREEILSEVCSLSDIAAIPSMERTLLTGSTELALAAVEALAANSHQAATEALARTAVFNDDIEVRETAARALSHRPRHSFVPLLLAGLRMPVHGDYSGIGSIGNQKLSRIILYQQLPSVGQGEFSVTEIDLLSKAPPDRTARGLERLTQNVNQRNSAQNDRIFAVLGTATAEKIERKPAEWWDWWYVSNDYYVPPELDYPIIVEYQRTMMRVSCFVRGTPVWTPTGSMPIEKIRPGESVLSQNPEAGELTYKPVLATTYRPLSPVLEIRLGKSIIRSTRGHPFWVSGIGWQMAKELKPGQHLHTVGGIQVIDSVKSTEEDVCYNLVVADCHNYFISDEKVLVHDNTLRSPLVARVPGLME